MPGQRHQGPSITIWGPPKNVRLDDVRSADGKQAVNVQVFPPGFEIRPETVERPALAAVAGKVADWYRQ